MLINPFLTRPVLALLEDWTLDINNDPRGGVIAKAKIPGLLDELVSMASEIAIKGGYSMTARSAPEIVFSDSMTDLNAWDNAISPLWTGSAWHQRSGGLEAIHYSLDLEGHSSGASTVPLFNELEGQAISASTGLLFNELEGLAGGASTAVLFNEVERNFDWVDRPRIGGIHKFRFFLYATCTGRPEMILADFGVAGEKAEVEAEFTPSIDGSWMNCGVEVGNSSPRMSLRCSAPAKKTLMRPTSNYSLSRRWPIFS